jgi:mono/diheme cytochrome c family protein
MTRILATLAGVYLITVLSVTVQSQSGQQIFRFDTFGDEQLWTDTLQMQTVVSSLTPRAALGLGLKVDVEALPPEVIAALQATPDALLDNPAVTIQLLALNAVVGVIGRVGTDNSLQSVGITCALCHSTVDDSFVPGVGRRLDGWPNRSLKVGEIFASSPALSETQKRLYRSWKPGFYDPRLSAFNGTSFEVLNRTSVPVLIPPAYALDGVGFETFTGDGSISYWNAYVGISQMGGHGNFNDPRIPLTIDQEGPDRVTPQLPALLAYQLSLTAPVPPPDSFDDAAAQRGRELFNGQARCDACHTPPTFTDVGGPSAPSPLLHSASETRMDPRYALRTVTGQYRTTPLRGIWSHPPYFHDGSAADLAAVVEHYNRALTLRLNDAQKADLVEYLKSL